MSDSSAEENRFEGIEDYETITIKIVFLKLAKNRKNFWPWNLYCEICGRRVLNAPKTDNVFLDTWLSLSTTTKLSYMSY